MSDVSRDIEIYADLQSRLAKAPAGSVERSALRNAMYEIEGRVPAHWLPETAEQRAEYAAERRHESRVS